MSHKKLDRANQELQDFLLMLAKLPEIPNATLTLKFKEKVLKLKENIAKAAAEIDGKNQK